jgi:hypothetical protein
MTDLFELLQPYFCKDIISIIHEFNQKPKPTKEYNDCMAYIKFYDVTHLNTRKCYDAYNPFSFTASGYYISRYILTDIYHINYIKNNTKEYTIKQYDYYKCGCGSLINTIWLKRHYKTKKHKKYKLNLIRSHVL